MILQKVLEFGLAKNYFEQQPIKDIEKSCCILDNIIIDFDKTKEMICSESNQVTRKSCDGLCLKENINFIEFKSINNFFDKDFKYKLKSNNRNLEENEIIKEKVLEFNFNKKIRDSLWVLDYILCHQEMQLNNDELEMCHDSRIEKNYYVVKDNYQPPLVTLALNINALSGIDHNQLGNRQTMDILINEALSTIASIKKPKLINCDELKEILKEEN